MRAWGARRAGQGAISRETLALPPLAHSRIVVRKADPSQCIVFYWPCTYICSDYLVDCLTAQNGRASVSPAVQRRQKHDRVAGLQLRVEHAAELPVGAVDEHEDAGPSVRV